MNQLFASVLASAAVFLSGCKPRQPGASVSSRATGIPPSQAEMTATVTANNFSLTLLGSIPITVEALPKACANPPSAIVAENCLPGSPPSEWDVPVFDPGNNGFTTGYSYAPGETVDFKIQSSQRFNLKIYRMGFYRGLGGRFIANVPSIHDGASVQPSCDRDFTTNHVSCANWSVAASWNIPVTQVSGVYMARMTLADGTATALIPFVIRNEARPADVLIQTSDVNWQIYNWYGGFNNYEPEFYQTAADTTLQIAQKVSYQRPYSADGGPHQYSARSWHFNFFSDHYAAIRFFERNGYNVNYIAGKDTANPRRLNYIKAHKAFVSLGHDEYWSKAAREHVEIARDNTATPWGSGTSLIFMSGNTMYERVRMEDDYQSVVSYKQSRLSNLPIDPGPEGDVAISTEQTSQFRDGRFKHLGNVPENQTTGLLYMIMTGSSSRFTVPANFAGLRFWRNTAVAKLRGTAIYRAENPHMVGYEADIDMDNGYRPVGLVKLSSTHITGAWRLGSPYGEQYDSTSGDEDHHMVFYRTRGGSYVWATGLIFFAFALDNVHDRYGNNDHRADPVLQQATVNMLADMKVQPATLAGGLSPASATTDLQKPGSVLSNLISGQTVFMDNEVELRGTARDIGGVVGAVDVSTDGGATWHPATWNAATDQWSYRWAPTMFGPATIRTRAVDDSGNLEEPSGGTPVSVVARGSLWGDAQVAAISSVNTGAHELGIRFSSDVDGMVFAVKFFKNHDGAGTYPVRVWDDSGKELAQGSVSVAAARRGWVRANLRSPVPIVRGRIYTASYQVRGPFASKASSLKASDAVYSNPLKERGSAYAKGPFAPGQAIFPGIENPGMNYWVDIAFAANVGTSPRVSLLSEDLSPAVTGTYVPSITPREAGMRFQAQTDGWVRGVRFYKNAANTGRHTVSLWRRHQDNNSGNHQPDLTAKGIKSEDYRMAWASSLNESPSGWQEVLFDQPVMMYGGQQYIVSYYTESGYQNAPSSLLPPRRSYNAPLKFISGMNVRAYSGSTDTAEQFAVDVIFQPTAARRASVFNELTSPEFDRKADVAGGKITPYELGTRFTTETDGYVTGVRFFVGTAAAGVHTARLWLSGQVTPPLATASAKPNQTGWVEAKFARPVRVLANGLYVASYATDRGYALTPGFFNHPYGALRPPVRLRGMSMGGNGMPAGPEPGGPNGVLSRTMGAYPRDFAYDNYWVEPVFITNLPGISGNLDASCIPRNVGAPCGVSSRCDASGQCVACNSWCGGPDQCTVGLNTCGAPGTAPACLVSNAPNTTLCRTSTGAPGKCNGNGVCTEL